MSKWPAFQSFGKQVAISLILMAQLPAVAQAKALSCEGLFAKASVEEGIIAKLVGARRGARMGVQYVFTVFNWNRLVELRPAKIHAAEASIITYSASQDRVEAGVFYALDAKGNILLQSPVVTSNSRFEIGSKQMTDGFNTFIEGLWRANLLEPTSVLHTIVTTHTHPPYVTVADFVAIGRLDVYNYSRNPSDTINVKLDMFSPADMASAGTIRDTMDNAWRRFQSSNPGAAAKFQRLNSVILEVGLIVPSGGLNKQVFTLMPNDRRIQDAVASGRFPRAFAE